jgi:hypothetical protein
VQSARFGQLALALFEDVGDVFAAIGSELLTSSVAGTGEAEGK